MGPGSNDKLDRLPLTTKLLIPPAVGIVMLAAVAATAYWGLGRHRQAISTINDLRFANLQLALEANNLIQQAHVAVTRRLSATGPPSDAALSAVTDRVLLEKVGSAARTLEFLGRNPGLVREERSAIADATQALHAYTTQVQKALAADHGADLTTLRTIDSRFVVLFRTLGALVGIERDLTKHAFQDSERQSRWIFLAFSALFVTAILASLAVTALVARHLRSRVDAIRLAATELAGGNLTRRVEVTSGDELGDAASAFNFLVDELDRAMSQLKLANRQLTAEMLAVLDASQALSSETDPRRLQARVVDLLKRITGADRVTLIAASADDTSAWLLVMDSAHGLEAPMPWDEAVRLGLLPLSVLRAARDADAQIVSDDATRDPRFAGDAYFGPHACCALMAVPILHQGIARAVLVLENTSAAGAFAALRHDIVMLIARQLAISLENVRVYQELEQRVQQRTSELRAAQSQLIESARTAGMAEVATNVLHNVGNLLNSVNVAANMIRRQVQDSRSGALGKAARLMNEHASDLGGFLSGDERGRLLPRYLSDLAEALAQERETLLGYAGTLLTSVDHITNIVSIQQSYARGGPAFMEVLRVQELVDAAVHMNAEGIEACGARLVKEVADFPALPMDKHRTMVVLVNLIKNACQAVQRSPHRDPFVKLSADIDGGKLRIVVSDSGEGIPAENLHRIFSHGFTSRAGGHGFGLHSCAVAAVEMGGRMHAASDGVGKGASFTLEIPVVQNS